jgi:chaperonin cofactor prefoldin
MFVSKWKHEVEIARREHLEEENAYLKARLQVVESKQEALNEMVKDLQFNLDQARTTAAMAALSLSEIAGEALEGDDFPFAENGDG